MRIKADLILIFVALLWGSAFAVQRAVSNQIGVFTFNGLRFLLASLFLLTLWGILRGIRANRSTLNSNPLPAARSGKASISAQRGFLYILLAGGLLFLASFLQQEGLRYTTAANAGFLTSLYVILVPILLWVFWRESIPAFTWVGACLAVIGSVLLSSNGTIGLYYGDLLEIFGALFWGLHVILISKVVWQMDLIVFATGQYFLAGIFNLFMGVWLETPVFYGLGDAWWGIVYTGILSIALGYTLQIYAQKYSPATDTAIILSMEAVFAAVFGFILLGEVLVIQQLMGAALILLAIVMTAVRANKVSEIEGLEFL